MLLRGGDLVREARRRAGISQAELAKRAGTTQSAIARIESGRTSPRFDMVVELIRLAGYRLDVGLDPYDDSDIAQANALRELTPEERLNRLVHTVAMFRSIREQVARRAG